jgi:hypothetical protein
VKVRKHRAFGDPDAWADLGAVGPASTLNMDTSVVVQVADAAERE